MILGETVIESGRLLIETSAVGLLGWALKKLIALENRLVRIETKLGIESHEQ